MTATILVIGGTGRLGRPVVALLRDAGCAVRVLTRHEGRPEDGIEHTVGDLRTGEGLEQALAGVATVVNCAGSPKGDQGMAEILVRAAARAGTTHLVNISVVGAGRVPVRSRVDRAMFGYFAAKLGAERVISGSGLPWTTLRASQFQDAFVWLCRAMSPLPVIPVAAGVRFQPVDTGRSRHGSRRSPSASRPAWFPRWRGRACTPWAICSAATCGPATAIARSSRSTCPAVQPARSGAAATSPPRGPPWAAGRGRSASTRRWSRSAPRVAEIPRRSRALRARPGSRARRYPGAGHALPMSAPGGPCMPHRVVSDFRVRNRL